MHDNLQFAATLIAILGGILFSRQDARRLEAKIDSVRTGLEGKIDALRADTRADSDRLRADIRGDMKILDNIVYDHHGRVTKLETKSETKP